MGCKREAAQPGIEALIQSRVHVLELHLGVDVNLRCVIGRLGVETGLMIAKMEAIENERALRQLKVDGGELLWVRK